MNLNCIKFIFQAAGTQLALKNNTNILNMIMMRIYYCIVNLNNCPEFYIKQKPVSYLQAFVLYKGSA